MARRSRKRKLEGEDEAGVKWELTNIFSEELRDEMATMWEIPQIFHFLNLSKEALNISHLSMYEMERMLAMPRASKQLAHIMTCLLAPPLPKAKMKKVPPMPYEFWVNVLTHKVKGWFKVYHSKHQDIVKVLETIGVEPGFWKIFPDSSTIDEKEFDQLTFKERVWILKTLCDTLMHSKKIVQDEMTKHFTDDPFETILGADRHGAKYFYFPLFLDNDLRVYRHCTDNAILSTVKPPSRKEAQTAVPKTGKHPRIKRKRSRWKNGSLPVQNRRRSRRLIEDELKSSGDSAIGSLLSEDTNMSGTSACSNNNNITIETIDRTFARSSSKTPDVNATLGETQCSNPKSSGYETNTSSDAKSLNGTENDESFRGFGAETDVEEDADVTCTVRNLLDGLTSKVSELVKSEISSNPSTPSKIANSTNGRTNAEDDDDTIGIDEKITDVDRELFPADSGSDDLNWNKCESAKSRTFDKAVLHREIALLSGILGDLGVSNFELVADSVESLRDLAAGLLSNELTETRSKSSFVPRCEFALARSIEELVETLKDVEPTLKESAKKARNKLQREWTQFKDGVVEDQDASGDVDHGSNRWIIGSQGCPLLSHIDATLQTLSDSALSSPSSKIPARRSSSVKPELRDPDGRTDVDGSVAESNEIGTPIDNRKSGRRCKIEDEKSGDDDSKNEPQTRRVLRRRGISSYTEQLSSSEEEAYELEEWSRFEANDETTGTPDGPSAVPSSPKIGQIGDEPATKDSDQDWLLPSSRKRKNKRSSGSRKLKTSPQKSNENSNDNADGTSNDGTTPPEDSFNASKTSNDMIDDESVPPICKVESVHSVLDIKDEGPIFDYNRSSVNPSDVDPTNTYALQYPHVPAQLTARPQGPVAPPVPPMPTNYYVQGHEQYFPPGPPPPFVQYTYPQPPGGPPRFSYHSGAPPPPYPGPPNQPNYWQYQQYGQQPPPMNYPGNMLRMGYPIQRNVAPQRQQGTSSSTTLYGARSPNKPPMTRMPAPRQTNVQTTNFRGTTRPRLPANRGTGRRLGPRNTAPQPPGMRMPRPNRTNNSQEMNANANSNANANANSNPNANANSSVKAKANKPTSLILLSDSDDEIEMIVQEKKSASPIARTNRQTTNVASPVKTVVTGDRMKSKPVVTSEIMVPKSREVLSPQMIQRMSQGGISITPVKPPAPKQITGESSQGTKLVVVNNETGSHYALALPNGSKLILTPEQVAQIRASNGGKLVL